LDFLFDKILNDENFVSSKIFYNDLFDAYTCESFIHVFLKDAYSKKEFIIYSKSFNRNLRFLSFSNVDFGSGTAIFTPPLNVTFTKC
jgi:hypothetical protein